MKKIILPFVVLLVLTSCGKGKSGKELAQEICDCSKKANAMPASDPERSEEQRKCRLMQQESWDKLKDDNEKWEFNEVISKCASEQIKSSFGQ